MSHNIPLMVLNSTNYVKLNVLQNICESLISKILNKYNLRLDDKTNMSIFLSEVQNTLYRYNTLLSLYNNKDIYNRTIEQHLVNIYNIFMVECPLYHSYANDNEYINFYEKLMDINSIVKLAINHHHINSQDDIHKCSYSHKTIDINGDCLGEHIIDYKVHNLSNDSFINLFDETILDISESSVGSLMTIFLLFVCENFEDLRS